MDGHHKAHKELEERRQKKLSAVLGQLADAAKVGAGFHRVKALEHRLDELEDRGALPSDIPETL